MAGGCARSRRRESRAIECERMSVEKNYKTAKFPIFFSFPSFPPSPRFMQWKLNKNHNSRTCVCLFTTRAVYSSSCLLSLRCMSCVCLLIANNFYISFGPVKVDMCIFMLYMFIKSLCALSGPGVLAYEDNKFYCTFDTSLFCSNFTVCSFNFHSTRMLHTLRSRLLCLACKIYLIYRTNRARIIH